MTKITTVGLDLAKLVFQVHGADQDGRPVVRKKLRRGQVLGFFAELPPCLIGLEACASAHYWARELQALGHEVRLIPPQYVKPFVKTNKNDASEAEAICEALISPTMRFASIKSAECGGDLRSADPSNDAVCTDQERRAAIGSDAAPCARTAGAPENDANQRPAGSLW